MATMSISASVICVYNIPGILVLIALCYNKNAILKKDADDGGKSM